MEITLFDIEKFFLPVCIIKFNGDIAAFNEHFSNQILTGVKTANVKQLNISSIFYQRSDFLDLIRLSKFHNISKDAKRRIYKLKEYDKSVEEDYMYCDIIHSNVEFEKQTCLCLQFYILTEMIEQHRKDMSIIKELQDKVSNTIVVLEKDKIIAEESSNKKSIFLASMSHELRTPLNSILGFTELLISEHSTNPDISEKLHFIYNECKRLNFLIDDILDFTKISDNKLKFNFDFFSLTELISKLFNMFKTRCSDKNIIFDIEKSSNTPDLVKGDSLRLLQILVNLIGNSIKFTPSGKITVIINYDFKNNILEISVKDTGIGIPEERQKTIFNPFDASADNIQRKYGGTGLGLSITLNLIKLMRGNLFLESKLGKGSMFTFKIPSGYKISESEKYGSEKILNPLSTVKNNEISDAFIEEQKKSALRKKILIVDDNPNILKLLQVMLSKLNFLTVKAVNGHEALMILERDNNFSAMLTDLMMPEMDGETAVKKIREIPGLKDLKIAAITAKNCRKEELESLGFNDYIKKPFTRTQIIEVLKRFEIEVTESRVVLENSVSNDIGKDKKNGENTESIKFVFPPVEPDFLFQVKSEIENSKFLDNREMVKLSTDFAFNLSNKLKRMIKAIETEDYSLLLIEVKTISAVCDFLNFKSITEMYEIVKGRIERREFETGQNEMLKMISSTVSCYNLMADFYRKKFAVNYNNIDISTLVDENGAEPLKIYIAEDDGAIRRLMQLKFEKIKGCSAFIFESGEKLIDAVKSDEAPDIIFTEIMMTGISGYEVAKKLRAQNFNKPIIALTGSSEIKDIELKNDKEYFDGWLMKPVDSDTLISEINKFSGGRMVKNIM